MPDGTGGGVTGGGEARSGSLTGRRARALARRVSTVLRRSVGLRPVQGCVDGAVAGEVRGWAFDEARPHRRVHVAARCDGKVVAEGLADLARRDLLKDGRGDGRCGFVLQLPPELAQGPARRVRIEALSAWGRTRLVGGDIVVGGEAAPEVQAPLQAVAQAAAPPPPLALLVWGEGDAAATLRSWSAQPWPGLEAARLGPHGCEGLPTLADPDALKAFARRAHTVLLARAGDVVDARAAPVLAEARPLADVVTVDDPSSAQGRRPEARALGVLVGESLGGAFAVRGHALAAHAEAAMDVAALELRLAGDGSLRWAHAPAPLVRRAGPLAGWRGEAAPPAPRASRLTLAVWPGEAEAWLATVTALIEAAPEMELEVLAPAALAAAAPAGDALEIRRIDPPDAPDEGRWLRLLGEAATGEAVVFCRAGVRPPSTLGALAAWALSPWCGAVTVQVEAPGAPLAGLALQRAADGWRLRSAFDAAHAGRARPVLAAPAAFMAISRAHLAAAGGFDDRRFPGPGADLDLGLRLRRMGFPSLLLGAPAAAADRELSPFAEASMFAGLDAAELAAAALAYPPA
jgi:hypothetical protein